MAGRMNRPGHPGHPGAGYSHDVIFDAARAANSRLETVEKSAAWLALTPDEFEKRAHIGSVIIGAWGVRRASILMTAGLRASGLPERDECLRWVGRERKE